MVAPDGRDERGGPAGPTYGPADDELIARVRASTAYVGAGPGAAGRVREALERRRRRRRARGAVASVATVAALGGAGVVVVPGLLDGGADRVAPVAPGERDPAPAIIQGGGYRPAGFFRDVVGGVAVPSIVRYYRTDPRVVFTARFDFTPDPEDPDGTVDDPAGDEVSDPTGAPVYLGALALERYRDAAVPVGQRCARLAGGTADCATREDGAVLARYEVPADGAFLAPVAQVGPLRLAGSTGVLRGVTYFRADARAVTVLVCDCSSRDGAIVGESPPVAFDVLEDVVTDDSWGLRVGG